MNARLIILLAIASMTLSTALAQHQDPQPKDDVIFISSKMTGDSLYTEIAKRLAKAGFPLTTTNREFGQIATGVRNMPEYNFGYSLVASFDGSKVELKPTVVTSGILGTYRWYYLKQKSAINYKVLEHLLTTMSGLGQVAYGREDG